MADYTPEGKKIKKIKVRLLEITDENLLISTDFIRLDAALKFSGVAETGGHAKRLVEDGRIRVNGEVCGMRGKKLFSGDNFECGSRRFTVISESGSDK